MRENENVDNFQEMFKKIYYFDSTFHLIFILQKVLKAEGLLGSCSSCIWRWSQFKSFFVRGKLSLSWTHLSFSLSCSLSQTQGVLQLMLSYPILIVSLKNQPGMSVLPPLSSSNMSITWLLCNKSSLEIFSSNLCTDRDKLQPISISGFLISFLSHWSGFSEPPFCIFLALPG